jgi:hypothetical protein
VPGRAYEFSCGADHFLARRSDAKEVEIFVAGDPSDVYRSGSRVATERILEAGGLVFLATENARPGDLASLQQFQSERPYFNEAEWMPFVSSEWTVPFDASWINLNHANRHHYSRVHGIDQAQWLSPPDFSEVCARLHVRTELAKRVAGLRFPTLSDELTTHVFGRGVGCTHLVSKYKVRGRSFLEQELFTINSYCPGSTGDTRVLVSSSMRRPPGRSSRGLGAFARFAHREFVKANREDIQFVRTYLPSRQEALESEVLPEVMARMAGYLQAF